MSNINVQGHVGGNVSGDTKKNTKITISIGSIVIIAIVGFIFFSFSNSIEKKIIGTWQLNNSNSLYEFTEDGQFIYLSGSSKGMTITYNISNKKLILNINILWGNTTVTANVNISGDTLILSDFTDPDDIFGVDDDEKLVFTKVN